MSRTDRVVKYLEEYKKLLCIKSFRTNNRYLAEHLEKECSNIDSLIKELKEHGCRRTVDRE